ncbi:MAG: methyl-accepting chemotaxis protein [Bacteriovoracaceae bacterium]
MIEKIEFEKHLRISKDWLDNLFPFYIVVDEYLSTLEFGPLLPKAIDDISDTESLDNLFEFLDDENSEIEFDSLKDITGPIKIVGKIAPLKLWGEVRYIEEFNLVLLLLTPLLKSENELTRYKIQLEELPLSDTTSNYLELISNTEGASQAAASKYAKEDEKKEQGFVVPGLDGSDIEIPEDPEALKDAYKKMAYEFGKVARASTELQDIIRDKTQELDMQVVMTKEALRKAEEERAKAETATEEALMAKDDAEKAHGEAEAAKVEVEKAKEELELAYEKVDKARAEARAEADEAIQDIVLLKNKAEEDVEILKGKVSKILHVVRFASEGDLTNKIPVSGTDPIGQVGDGLNEFFNNLKNSVKEIESCSSALKNASYNLKDNNRVMKNNSAETTDQTFQATKASDKVTSGMREVEGSMKNMIMAIKEITQITTEASSLANQTSDLARSTNETITQLDVSSTKIGEVIKLIQGIAHQTNLLSLNAQIEAMWAGEAGKGFRVVANEVKELSKQTAMATSQVESMITNIQSDSKKAISAVTQISESIMTMTSYTQKISDSMVQQSSYTGLVSEVVAGASESIKEINESIILVKESAKTTDSAIDTSQNSAENVGTWSENLDTLVARFKI